MNLLKRFAPPRAVEGYHRKMAMNFTELTSETRHWMLRGFCEEEAGGNPYRSRNLSVDGLKVWPSLMHQAITSGDEVVLGDALKYSVFWNSTETYVRSGVSRSRAVNVVQASERIALTEFNTWYVWGLASRLLDEGETHCTVYRAADAKWAPASCSQHEGLIFSLLDIVSGHRASYWPSPGVTGQFSIPAEPGCHHTIERTRP